MAGSVRSGAAIKPTNIVLSGGFQQLAGGILSGVLDGEPSDPAAFAVSGTVTLGGKLLVSRDPSPWPSPGDRFPTLTAGAVSGTFAEVIAGTSMAGYEFAVEYGSNAVEFVFTGAPNSHIGNWLEDTFTATEQADPTISGFYADPDGDGRSNLREYLEVTDATTFDAPQNGELKRVEDAGKNWFEIATSPKTASA